MSSSDSMKVPRLTDAQSCPFCVSSDLYMDFDIIDEEELHFVVCHGCGTEGPTSPLPDVARMLWNIRQPEGKGKIEAVQNKARRSPCMDCAEALLEPVDSTVCPCLRLRQWQEVPK